MNTESAMKTVTVTELCSNIYTLLDEIIDTGMPLTIQMRDKKLQIIAVEPVDRLRNLVKRPGVITGDPEDLVSISWETESNRAMNDQTNLNPPAILEPIEAETAAAGFAMASDRQTGSLLRTLAASKPGGALLELGTGSGLSTAWILDGMSANATLDTLDNDPEIQSIARTHLGDDPRLTIHTRDGDEFIRALAAAGATFDFIFADTWPGKLRLLDETLTLLKPGGLYVVDDMLPQPNWETLDLGYDHPAAIRTLTTTLQAHPDLHSTELAWSTGIIIATKIGGIS